MSTLALASRPHPLAERARSLRRKLRRSLRRRGLAGTLRFFATALAARYLPFTGIRVPYEDPAREFDARFGTETVGSIELSRLAIDSPSAAHGVCYQATPPVIFHELLGRLDIPHAEFTFVDVGSGKGIAMLLASDYPFRRIVGVEFSPELHAIALRNVAAYRSPAQRCRAIEPLCMNALDMPLPDGPCVFYMYNPFRFPVATEVVERIAAAHRAARRPIYVAYYNPAQRRVFDAHPGFEFVAGDVDWVVYRCIA